jgi:uncharacterized protein (TIGR00299 family) protein
MKIAYFDLIGGASGDMILGALIDAGLQPEVLQEGFDRLNLSGFQLHWQKVSKMGFQATKVDLDITDIKTERHLADILEIIAASSLSDHIKAKAISIFKRMGEVEGGIHGLPIEKVHLHELGGLDTILDVTGALIGLDAIGIDQIHCSPFPLGRGFVKGAHGQIPLPAPATVALLRGVPVTGSAIEKELVTPTGAAILTGLAVRYGSIPAMALDQIGYGAGGRDLPVPNLMRVLIGRSNSQGNMRVESLVSLETNIDDLNPQLYDFLMERLFQAGALDVTLTPMHMKKNRPAVQVNVLCPPEKSQELEAILFSETSTIGIRKQIIERHALPRKFGTVQTPYGLVRVKTVEYAPGKTRSAAEFEDCRRLAQETGAPLWEIYQAATNQHLE